MQTISNTQTCALSQFYDWLTCRNVRVTDSWLLLLLPAGGGSAAWWWPRPVLRGLCVTGMLVSGYSLLPSPFPPTLSRIMDHKTACTRACAAGGWPVCCLNALWSSCVMRSVNSWWTCSDARNIGRYNSSRFDTIHPVSVPIRYRSDNRPFSSFRVIYWCLYCIRKWWWWWWWWWWWSIWQCVCRADSLYEEVVVCNSLYRAIDGRVAFVDLVRMLNRTIGLVDFFIQVCCMDRIFCCVAASVVLWPFTLLIATKHSHWPLLIPTLGVVCNLLQV